MNQAMIIMCGLQCCGKSTTANKLKNDLGIEMISTDSERLASNFDTANRGLLERFVIYNRILKKAETFLRQGRSVVLDGTFYLRILRQAAYYVAFETNSNAYVIECICCNLKKIRERYENRKKNNYMLEAFESWTKIEGYKAKFSEFEPLYKEVLPDGTPASIIRYNTETANAEIIYSDGSETIQRIIEAINNPVKVKV